MKLKGLQRLMCLDIAGTIRVIPVETFNDLLGLSSFSLSFKTGSHVESMEQKSSSIGTQDIVISKETSKRMGIKCSSILLCCMELYLELNQR